MMNESEQFSPCVMHNICRICLKTTSHLNAMSEDHIKNYKSFVGAMAQDKHMKICQICEWMLRKFARFKHQCQEANNLLERSIDIKPSIHGWSSMTQTQVLTHSYVPTENDKFSNKNSCEKIFDNSVNNDPENDDESSHFEISYHQCEMNDEMAMRNDGDVFDDDEVPLVKFKRRKRRKKSVTEMILLNGIKEELEITDTDPNIKTKKKRNIELKDGFTSRMVQETDEYIVIKLTKEEVLKEMDEKAKNDSYIRSPFRCEKCVKGFNFEDVLQTHLEKHSRKNGNFKCDICSQYCPSAVSLRGHIKSHTTRYKCKLCGHIRLSRQHLLEHHAISHTNAATSYNCDYCKFTTNKRTVMQRHVRRHASDESHACHKCGKLFKSIESLRLHTVRHDTTSRYGCGRCGATFVYASLLRRHELYVHERREYYCVECDVQFNSAESLRLHFQKAKKHRDSSSYKHACPQCPERFFTRASLGVHLTSAHDLPKTHACDMCARLYSSRDAVRAHMWRAHRRKKNDGAKSTVKSKDCTASENSLHTDNIQNMKEDNNMHYGTKIEE